MINKWNSKSEEIITSAYQNSKDYLIGVASDVFDPQKYIYVNPNEIQFRCGLSYPQKGSNQNRLANYGKIIKDTNWEHFEQPVQKYKLYDCLVKRIVHGQTWDNSGVYDLKLREVERAGRPIDGCLSKEDFIKRYEKIDQLIEKLIKNDFKRQIDLSDDANISNEMFVSIGKTGRIYFSTGGNHRMFISQILRLKSVPFLVLARDIDWVEIVLKNLQENNLSYQHPDMILRDFI